ncbi:MAG: hypothetical protein ACC652_14845 [Acidimicrobiales bacterium]
MADHRHLTVAADELEQAEAQLAEADLLRALAANRLADFWDLGNEPVTLSLLLTRASDQEAQLLVDRQEQLLGAMRELEDVKNLASELASVSLGEVQSRVASMQAGPLPSPLTYDDVPQDLAASVQQQA